MEEEISILKGIIKIAITGPESSGKSFLTQALAEHFNTCSTIEFARKYLEENGPKYDEELIHFFIEQQIALEDKALKSAHRILFCDTDLINFKIWLRHEGYEIPQELSDKINQPFYDFNLLLKPNIPWESDQLRQFPNDRDYFFILFEKELNDSASTYGIVDEDLDKRLAQSIQIIDNFLGAL